MDTATLFGLIHELSNKVGALGQNLAGITASVSWLEWWVKLLIVSSVGNMVVGSLNTALLYKNGKHNDKSSD